MANPTSHHQTWPIQPAATKHGQSNQPSPNMANPTSGHQTWPIQPAITKHGQSNQPSPNMANLTSGHQTWPIQPAITKHGQSYQPSPNMDEAKFNPVHNVYRKLLGLCRRSSVSEMFAINNISNFEALIRKSIFAFKTRLSNSD